MKLSDLAAGTPDTATPDAPKRMKLSDLGQAAPPAPAEPEGMFTRIWHGMMGKDVSRAGRYGMGVADPAVGMAQSGARAPIGEAIDWTGKQSLMQPDTQAVDKAVQQREQSYRQREKAAGLSGGLGSEWARILGNMTATAPLAAAGGAAAPASAAGRIGLAAGLGAASSLMNPTDDKNFAAGKLKQGAEGLAGGAVGGAAGEAVGSTLARAIAGNSPQMIERAMSNNRLFRTTIKPSRVGQQTETQLGNQDRRIMTAIDQIVANRPSLELTNEAGQTVKGQLPRSVRQFSEAIDQTKARIFQQYDGMAARAEGQGVRVDLRPMAQRLRQFAARKEVIDADPSLAARIEEDAARYEARGFYTPREAQGAIKLFNEQAASYWKNPKPELATRTGAFVEATAALRESLDNAIESATEPGYQALKLQYGALRSIEKDVAGAVQREANKIPGGLGSVLLDTAASEEFLRGVITADPAALGRAGAMKAAKFLNKHIYSPNRAITKLFDRAAARGMYPEPGRIATGAAGALSGYGAPVGGLAGGLTPGAATGGSPSYPWQPQN